MQAVTASDGRAAGLIVRYVSTSPSGAGRAAREMAIRRGAALRGLSSA